MATLLSRFEKSPDARPKMVSDENVIPDLPSG
jgi:hypothetical protein